MLLITALLAPLLFLGLVARADVYRSEAILQVGAGDVAEEVLGQPRAYEEPGRRVATEIEILTSTAVEQRAAQRLAEDGWQISDRQVAQRIVASPRGLSNFVEVVGSDANPVRARTLTQALVDAYLEYRRESKQADLERVRDDLQSRLRAAEVDLATLDANTGADAAAARERASVVARFETLTELVEAVRLRLSIGSSDVRVLALASTPDGPADAVPPVAAALLALLGAVLLGSGGLLLYELARDTVRTRAEAERLIPTRTLVQMPRFKNQEHRWGRVLRKEDHPVSAAAGTLRIRISGIFGGMFPNSLLVTGGADDADDCLWVASALAAECGRAGSAVLLIANPVGAAGSLVDVDDQQERVAGSALAVSRTRLPRVWWAPIANNEHGTIGLRGTSVPAQELAALGRRFEVVILVAPVVEPVDAVAMSHLAAATVCVCSVGRSRARRLQMVAAALQEDGASLCGMVLTSAGGRRSTPRSRVKAALAPAEPYLDPVVAGRDSDSMDTKVVQRATDSGSPFSSRPAVADGTGPVDDEGKEVTVFAETRSTSGRAEAKTPWSLSFEGDSELTAPESAGVSARTDVKRSWPAIRPTSRGASRDGTGWPPYWRRGARSAEDGDGAVAPEQAEEAGRPTSSPDPGEVQATIP